MWCSRTNYLFSRTSTFDGNLISVPTPVSSIGAFSCMRLQLHVRDDSCCSQSSRCGVLPLDCDLSTCKTLVHAGHTVHTWLDSYQAAAGPGRGGRAGVECGLFLDCDLPKCKRMICSHLSPLFAWCFCILCCDIRTPCTTLGWVQAP